MNTTNFLQETIDALSAHGKKPSDVVWAGAENFAFVDWEDFASSADFDYSNSHWENTVPLDLVLCGNDFFFTRIEQGDKEVWEYHHGILEAPRTQLYKLNLQAEAGARTTQSLNS